MIFIPYPDEMERIHQIQRYQGTDYALIRLTFTMIDKNNLDAGGLLRDLLLQEGIVDYARLAHGGENGIDRRALLLLEEGAQTVRLRFYRVANRRGDRRFSIETIGKKARQGLVSEGDLLYFTVAERAGEKQILLFNLTHHFPSEEQLRQQLGEDRTLRCLRELLPQLRRIRAGGYYDNSKGPGKIAPKDVGDTLEGLLGIQTNNKTQADYKGEIEIKAKKGRTMDTLFTLRPEFEGTPIASYETEDEKRVSAFARYYGYNSDKHPGCRSLYITVGSELAPQNGRGFYLKVNEEAHRVELRRREGAAQDVMTAYWSFDVLQQELYQKHPATIWVTASSRMRGEMGQFRYEKFEFSRAPRFATFLSLIKEGGVVYDWRGYTTPSGKYSGKNQGNAWRIRSRRRGELFGRMETLKL